MVATRKQEVTFRRMMKFTKYRGETARDAATFGVTGIRLNQPVEWMG
jgi:hypothetical protein